jgi:hypothetical protein
LKQRSDSPSQPTFTWKRQDIVRLKSGRYEFRSYPHALVDGPLNFRYLGTHASHR